MNDFDVIELKHLVQMLRTTYHSQENIAKKPQLNEYGQGISAGMEIANGNFLPYIERLEALMIKELNKNSLGYLLEDVDLNGMKEETA